MKKVFISTAILSTILIGSTKAQITQSQARSVDSALVAEYLTEGNFHTENYHSTLSGGVFTWDAGNGLYVNIPDYYVAWSFVGEVEDSLAAEIDNMEGEAYHLFDLSVMPNTEAYRDSVELWFSEIGIPVGIDEQSISELKLYPNPMNSHSRLYVNLFSGQRYTLTVQTIGGKVVYNFSEKTTKQKNSITLPVSKLKRGIYIFTLTAGNRRYSTLGVKE